MMPASRGRPGLPERACSETEDLGVLRSLREVHAIVPRGVSATVEQHVCDTGCCMLRS